VSEPRKHHYVPVCYLKQWAMTDDRRLCEYKLIPGGYGVKPRRTSPEGTGYQIDLYRIDGVPDNIAQDFEKRFMHLVVLETIIAGEHAVGLGQSQGLHLTPPFRRIFYSSRHTTTT
jgi:hypothetical protein